MLLILSILSCKQKTNLQKEFICETKSFSNTEIVSDFNNTFNITVPKHWKTQLYFNNLQTQIFTADTTKNLTNTYTLNFEYNSGDLIINDDFSNKIIKDLNQNNYILLKSKNDVFKNKPSIWFVSKGKKSDFDYFYFELYVKQTNTNYFKITSEIYGDKNLDERFCESIAVIETLKVLD